MSEFQPVLDYVQSIGAGAALGLFGAASAAFYGFVRVYRLNPVQRLVTKLPVVGPYLCWDNWPKGLAVGLVLGLPVVAAGCASIASGAAPAVVVSACVAALMAALSSGGIDGAVQAVRPTPAATLTEAQVLSDQLRAGGIKRDPMEGKP